MIRLVKQEHARGCGPAVIAMLTGKTYAEVIAALPPRDWEKDGIHAQFMDDYLAECGVALARKFRFRGFNLKREPWPPAAFCGVHVCQVLVAPESPVLHFAIWTQDFRGGPVILDPMRGELAGGPENFHEVHWVAGVGYFSHETYLRATLLPEQPPAPVNST